MPSKTLRQHNLMAMVANNPKAAKRTGIPQSVGEEYMKADKGLKFGKGLREDRPDRQKVNRGTTNHGKSALFSKGGDIVKSLFKGKESYGEELKEARAIKAGKITPEQYARGEKMEDAKKKPKRMNTGGMSDAQYEEKARKYREEESRTTPTPKEQEEMRQQAADRRQLEVQKQKNAKPMQYKKGGLVSRGDGIAQRGKTRGRLV